MKKAAILLALLVTLGVLAGAQEETRGFYIDVGGGWTWIKYPDPFNTMVKNIAKISGISRTSIDIDLSIGYALHPRFYLVGSLGGVIDSLSAVNTLSFTTLTFGPGIKFYPLPSMKYLQLGFDMGYSSMSVSLSDSSESFSGPGGFAMQLSVFGDFDSTLCGPALLMGAKGYLGILDGEMVSSVSVVAKFVFKGRKK